MALPDLDIDLLRAFVAVCDAGSFTAAADVVARSQSAVSQKIRRLEDLVEQPLFERTSRAVILTTAGAELLTGARRLLELNDDLVRSLRSPQATGRLRIGICEDFVPSQLARLLARFRRMHPAVHLEINTSLTHNLLLEFDAGRVDLVVAMAQRHGRGRVIWREPMVWFAASDFRLDLSQPVPLVLLAPPCTYRDLIFATLDAVAQPWFTACTVSSLAGVQSAVAGGLGISLLGQSFIQQGLQTLTMPEQWPRLPMTEVVLIENENAERGAAAALVSFLLESLRAPVGPV
jgi:DNA-binding transcriptional LysR family regulator